MKVTMYKEDEVLVDRFRDLWLDSVDSIKFTGLHNWVGLRGARRGSARTRACELLWTQMQILWDGQITLCCFDSMEGFFNMGNAADVNISEYWRRGLRLASVRAAHVRGDFSELSVCATCNQNQYFTRHFLRNSPRTMSPSLRAVAHPETD
jgi:hypothetical protein